jgi:hypothetical protein
MPRYLIELPHGDERVACIRSLHAIDEFGSHFVTHADWGCDDGVHCAWLIAELDSREDAMHLIPRDMRQDARIVQLNKFTREEIATLILELEA